MSSMLKLTIGLVIYAHFVYMYDVPNHVNVIGTLYIIITKLPI